MSFLLAKTFLVLMNVWGQGKDLLESHAGRGCRRVSSSNPLGHALRSEFK
jgi:hypothetical protein